MKKMIPKIILLLIVVAIILGGKYFIDYKTYDYREAVNDSLTEYFITGDTDDLKPIIKILDEHADDEKYRKDLQSFSGDFVGSWFVYIDSKYECSLGNKNSCAAQHVELTELQKRLTALYECEADDNYTIIVPSVYNSLNDQATQKITAISNILNSPSAKDAPTIEETRIRKCSMTTECESCREGTCVCYYTDSSTKVREELVCYNKILPENQNGGY